MARRRVPEEHDNHEAWAIPYGDLMTLLLAFFVVMYSISSVNSGKYRVLSDALSAEFRGTPRAPQPIPIGELKQSISEQMPITEVNRMFTAGLPAHMLMPLPQARGSVREGQPTAGSADPRIAANAALIEAEAARQKELAGVEADVSGVLANLIRNKLVSVHKQGDSVQVQISADILFASGVAEPAPAALPVLQRLADSLKPWPNSVRVDGHTDNVPIRSGVFHSNWELSAARAGSVVRLFSERGVDPQRLAVVGYGQYRPLQDNSSATGRNANRRVVVIIMGRGRDAGYASP
jgi:chemotaxis protein MotB